MKDIIWFKSLANDDVYCSQLISKYTVVEMIVFLLQPIIGNITSAYISSDCEKNFKYCSVVNDGYLMCGFIWSPKFDDLWNLK